MMKKLIEKDHPQLSIRRQCELLKVNRNRLAGKPKGLSERRLEIRRAIDEVYVRYPYYGSRRIAQVLQRQGLRVGRCRVRREMRSMGIRAIYPRPRTSIPSAENPVYPYLLRDLEIDGPDHVWCCDITYIPMRRGYAYLVAIMDWKSRAVLSWELSNTLDTEFCIRALEIAFKRTGTRPEIFNTDQGCQFTSKAWIDTLIAEGIEVSMDGKGRWIDNVFIERLWRSIKYEDIYLKCYEDLEELRRGITRWISHYNGDRPHQALGDQTPWEVYRPESRRKVA